MSIFADVSRPEELGELGSMPLGRGKPTLPPENTGSGKPTVPWERMQVAALRYAAWSCVVACSLLDPGGRYFWHTSRAALNFGSLATAGVNLSEAPWPDMTG